MDWILISKFYVDSKKVSGKFLHRHYPVKFIYSEKATNKKKLWGVGWRVNGDF